MKTKLLIFSTSKNKFSKFKCTECGDTIVVGSDDGFCPQCYMPVGKRKKKNFNLKANVSKTFKPRLKCSACGKLIFTNSNLKDDALVNSSFCPSCGESDLTTKFSKPKLDVNAEEIIDDEENNDEIIVDDPWIDTEAVDENQNQEDGAGESDNLVDTPVAEGEDNGSNYGNEEEMEQDITKDEDEVIEELESFSEGNLEASLISQPEPSWVFFKAGTPVFKLMKSKVQAEAQYIFDKDSFVNAFEQRVKNQGFSKTLKEFNAEIINPTKMMSAFNIDEMAYTHLNDKVLPKFNECIALAIEGACKSVYPELNSELKAQFFDELLVAGLTKDKAVGVIESSFGSGSQTVFNAIIAKAMELLNKDDSAFNEIKATIQASGKIKASVITAESHLSEDELQVREKLNASSSNMVFKTDLMKSSFNTLSNLHKTSVSEVRNKIKFKK